MAFHQFEKYLLGVASSMISLNRYWTLYVTLVTLTSYRMTPALCSDIYQDKFPTDIAVGKTDKYRKIFVWLIHFSNICPMLGKLSIFWPVFESAVVAIKKRQKRARQVLTHRKKKQRAAKSFEKKFCFEQ